MKDMSELRKHLTNRREALRNVEQKHENQWRDLRDYVQPYRGRFSGEKPDEYTPSFSKILDSTPLTSVRLLSAGMQSGLTSPSRQWFKISIHDLENRSIQSVQEWCDEVQSRMLAVMSSSGFYRALHMLYEELAIFGTGAIVILPSETHVIECHTMTAGTYYLGRSQGSTIDTFYRDMWMSAGEMVSEFGEENCSSGVVSALKNNKDELFKVYHAIEPDTMGVGPHRFMSVYWEPSTDNDKVLRIGGFDSFPVMTPRWTCTDSDVYGYGPAAEALPDIKTLVAMKTDFLTGIKKQINPPLVASRQVLTGGVKTMPGGITYVDGRVDPMIEPLYNVGLDIRSLATAIEGYKNDIKRAMYVDLFMMLSDGEGGRMTAREVAERHEEKMLALGPVLEGLEWELLIPAIDRVFGVMQNAHLIPPAPEDAQDGEVKIEFVSVLAQAQKMMGLSALEQSLGFVGNMAQFDQSVLDTLDTEKCVRTYVEMVGAPANMLKEEAEVEQIRAQRQQAQAQQQQLQNMQQAAQIAGNAGNAAQSLSQVPMTNGGSALDALAGSIQAGQGSPLSNIIGGMQ